MFLLLSYWRLRKRRLRLLPGDASYPIDEHGEVALPALHPQDLSSGAIEIQLEPQTAWAERPDLYRSESNPAGLDPAHWRVSEAQYHCYVFWDTQGWAAYQVNGRQNFVVIEDLRLGIGAERKFLLYRWEDLGSIAGASLAVIPSAWTQVKTLYAH